MSSVENMVRFYVILKDVPTTLARGHSFIGSIIRYILTTVAAIQTSVATGLWLLCDRAAGATRETATPTVATATIQQKNIKTVKMN